jgi:5-methylcytosine-specific restriction endonuclease McrA
MKVRAKRAGATGSHTIAEWKSVLRHFGRKCVYCNTKLTRHNVSRDHVTPLSRGGTNDIRNIVPACRKCNIRKHTRTPGEFRKVLQTNHFQ